MKKPEINVFATLNNVNRELQRELKNTQYYVVGGIPTEVLKDSRTEFKAEDRLIIPDPNIELSNYRPNGTLRDIDILVLSRLSKSHLKYLGKVVSESTKGALIPSVFGLHQHHEQQSRLKSGLLNWVSKRTIDQSGVLRYELFPLSGQVDSRSYEPWQLILEKDRFQTPILNPVAHLAAYNIRSIGGLRPKDMAKVQAMRENINQKAPGLIEDSLELGIGDWFDFSKQLNDMIKSSSAPDGISNVDFKVFKMKSNLLRRLESNPKIVKISYNKALSRVIELIVHS